MKSKDKIFKEILSLFSNNLPKTYKKITIDDANTRNVISALPEISSVINEYNFRKHVNFLIKKGFFSLQEKNNKVCYNI